MIFRLFDSNDLAKCAKLFVSVFTDKQFGFSWLTEEKALAYLTDMVNSPKSLSFVCVDDTGSVIGACFGVVNDCFPSAYYDIKEIFVLPEHQGKGTGSVFLSEVELLLSERGIKSVSLNTDKTTPAYHFYEKNGYILAPSSVLMFKKL